MGEQLGERHLAAVLAADVAGYSRLMGADEEGTLRTLLAFRRELIDPKIAEHRGRLVKSTGDGVLVEFASAVDAVRCALDVQRGIASQNMAEEPVKRIEFRIGINVGDIILNDGDIYGDGVNVAARLEGLAEPGGICISGTTYDHIHGKLDAAFDDLGPQSVKNIARPIRVLRLREKHEGETAGGVSSPVPGFQGRPAIAVLPLQNMSGDPEQEYFADGLAEDILTRLAMWRWCPIIARNSSFAYKGRNVDVRQIGRELGARYVLEGSVRKAGDRVRITGQLIDTETGHHIWANRYDRRLDDIFAVQDEIVDAITAALEPAVGHAETQRASLKPPSSLDAWELHHRGMWHFLRATRADFAEARKLLAQAIERDPTFALPHSTLAIMGTFDVLFAWTDDPQKSLLTALNEAHTATGLDRMDAFAQAGLCQACNFMRQYENALAAGRRATELNPSSAIGHHVYGIALLWAGQPAEAVEAIARAIRLSPSDMGRPFFLSGLALAHYSARNYDKAVEASTLSVQMLPQSPIGQRAHAAALAQLGRLDAARAALEQALSLSPGLTEEALQRSAPYRANDEYQHFAEGLRKAGWQG